MSGGLIKAPKVDHGPHVEGQGQPTQLGPIRVRYKQPVYSQHYKG